MASGVCCGLAGLGYEPPGLEEGGGRPPHAVRVAVCGVRVHTRGPRPAVPVPMQHVRGTRRGTVRRVEKLDAAGASITEVLGG